MTQNGKGSTRRKKQISAEEFSSSWEITFGQKKKCKGECESCESCPSKDKIDEEQTNNIH